jgi:hypothetical protein
LVADFSEFLQYQARKEATKEQKATYLTNRAWEIAVSPGKQFMMTAFMMWMMGSGVHIMNIIFTFYQVKPQTLNPKIMNIFVTVYQVKH